MAVRRLVILLNPVSGRGGRRRAKYVALRQAKRYGDERKLSVEVARTEYPGHAEELARRCADTVGTRVVAVGGDGTVNEVARGLVGREAVLAIVPMGSGNGLARHLDIPLNPRQALDLAVDGPVVCMDRGEIDGQSFFTTAGVGLDAEVGWLFAQLGGRGMANYVKATSELYFRYKPKRYRIRVDGREIQRHALMLTFANASQFGNNARIAPHARVDDGVLDMVIVKPFPKLAIGVLASLLMNGLLDRSPYLEVIPFREAEVVTDGPGRGHVDGEPVTLSSRFEVRVHPSAVRVVAGACAAELRDGVGFHLLAWRQRIAQPAGGAVRRLGMGLRELTEQVTRYRSRLG